MYDELTELCPNSEATSRTERCCLLSTNWSAPWYNSLSTYTHTPSHTHTWH